MQLRFVGGPWDGATLDIAVVPDKIGLRLLLIDMKTGVDEKNEFFVTLPSDDRTHHQYLLEWEGDPDDPR